MGFGRIFIRGTAAKVGSRDCHRLAKRYIAPAMELLSMDYDIIEAVSSEGLVNRVRKKLADGWRPLGAPLFVANTWCQTMILGAADASHINQSVLELSGTIERK